MKKILYFLMLGAALWSLASCEKIDNWDEPNARIYGNVIDSYTGTNLMMDQNDWQIRIIDRTWEQMHVGSKAQYQNLPVMKDGVYNNSKLFSGTYDMLPYDGPFWPVDTIKGVVLDSETQQDFTVTPYLQVLDAVVTLGGTALAPTLTFTCNVKAPIVTGLPNLYEVRPFLSLTTFCGNSNNISIGDYNTAQQSTSEIPSAKRSINRSWAAELTARKLPANSEKIPYTMGPLLVKPGYTYYVRIGANVNALSRRYNYSPIMKVVVP